MSAFMVNDETINGIIALLNCDRRMNLDLDTRDKREDLGKKLFQMNIDSIHARYGEGQAKEFRPLDYKFMDMIPPNIFQALKSLQCLLYQCLEGDVSETKLYKDMHDIEIGLMHQIIDSLPEYDRANWG